MYCILDILDDLVLNQLQDNSVIGKPSMAELKDCVTTVSAFRSKFQDQLFRGLLQTEKDKQVKKYIHTHQTRLIYFADTLFSSISQHDNNLEFVSSGELSLLEVQKKVCLMIEEMISSLKLHYRQHFDLDHVLPLRQRQLTVLHFQKSVALLKRNLKNTDPKLVDIITDPFLEFSGNNKPLTYGKTAYLNELLVVLKDITNAAASEKTTLLIKTLFLSDFNYWRFLNYLNEDILDKIRKESTEADKLKKYYYFSKIINQTYIDPQKRLYPECQSLTDTLSCWISEEIEYLKHSQSIQPLEEAAPQLASDQAIDTTLSVPLLAFLIRLSVDSGIIPSSQLSKLLTLSSRHFKTKKTRGAAPGSLSKKYYTVESSTAKRMREILLSWIHLIDEKYLILSIILANISDLNLDQLFIL